MPENKWKKSFQWSSIGNARLQRSPKGEKKSEREISWDERSPRFVFGPRPTLISFAVGQIQSLLAISVYAATETALKS